MTKVYVVFYISWMGARIVTGVFDNLDLAKECYQDIEYRNEIYYQEVETNSDFRLYNGISKLLFSEE